MADDDVLYTCDLGEEQAEAWKSKLDAFVTGAKPDSFTLSGSAVSSVQQSLNGFSTKVAEGFDDNNELGVFIHEVLVGHHHKMIKTDADAAEHCQPGEGQ